MAVDIQSTLLIQIVLHWILTIRKEINKIPPVLRDDNLQYIGSFFKRQLTNKPISTTYFGLKKYWNWEIVFYLTTSYFCHLLFVMLQHCGKCENCIGTDCIHTYILHLTKWNTIPLKMIEVQFAMLILNNYYAGLYPILQTTCFIQMTNTT